MMTHKPDAWVIIKLPACYKVLASWNDEYWQTNSGIVSVKKSEKKWIFTGRSGSEYVCHQDDYRLTSIMHMVLDKVGEFATVLEPTTNWETLV